MQEVADGQRFCNRCGGALEGGRCGLHGYDVSTHPRTVLPSPAPTPTPAPPTEPWWQPASAPVPVPVSTPSASRPSWLGPVAVAVAVFFLFALVGDHIYLQQKVDGTHAALNTLS